MHGFKFLFLLITPPVGVERSHLASFCMTLYFSAAALKNVKVHHCVQKVMVSERFSLGAELQIEQILTRISLANSFGGVFRNYVTC